MSDVIAKALHRVLHWFRMQPTELLEVVHAPDCPGFCIAEQHYRRCDVKLRLRCIVCGEQKLI